MMSFKKLITKGNLFYFGLLLKICLGTFFASEILIELFIPFIDYFVSNGFANPYEYFFRLSNISYFPYPALMLYILSLFNLLLGWILPNNKVFMLFIYRLPLICADIFIYSVIKSWLKEKYHNKVIYFYWFSPVLIYISYVHGQLDVIPIAFLFGSLYYLFEEKIVLSVLFMGMALSTKTIIILVLPFYGLYFFSKYENKLVAISIFVMMFVIFILFNIPYLFDDAFFQMVFQNQEQSKFFDATVSLQGLTVFLTPASLLILFVRGALIKIYNRDIFIMFLGFSFSLILLFIPPMPGWYFWLIPFLSYFYIRGEGRSCFLFFGLQFFYLLYFMMIKDSDYLSLMQGFISDQTVYNHLVSMKIDAAKVLDLTFTMLQTTLLINCFWLYLRGLENYSNHKITSSPFLIGIGGNSGAGKTILADAIFKLFTSQNTTVIHGDDMHKWQRNHENWSKITHLHPKANYLYREISLLKKLKSGRQIFRRHYDHNTGEFTLEDSVAPKNIIVFEGLLPFYLLSQRELYDLKIFVKPTLDLLYHWKIIRDQGRRGYSKDKVIDIIKKRESDSKKYVETQLDSADIVIEVFPMHKIKNIGSLTEEIVLYYCLTLSNEVDMEFLVETLERIETLKITHEYAAEDVQKIIIQGTITDELLYKISSDYIYQLSDLGVNTFNIPKGLFGLLIVMLAYYIFEKEAYERE